MSDPLQGAGGDDELAIEMIKLVFIELARIGHNGKGLFEAAQLFGVPSGNLGDLLPRLDAFCVPTVDGPIYGFSPFLARWGGK